MLFLSDLRASVISLWRVVYFLDSFENFWSLGFLVRKDCIVSYEEKETGRRGRIWVLYIRGYNKAKEGKVSQFNLDRPSTAIYARIKGEGYVISRIGNGRTAAMVY